ncbi:activating signal cointegrator 1 [Trichogramma pretiosum]|uniref:activating signal cointegrator 1 n=1 Tax=Trichogramma pretiosum TaxID=7493 RepID=UPI0006C94C53|nr:activating signal cointegrator 1 [Trichogramma pretiosum]
MPPKGKRNKNQGKKQSNKSDEIIRKLCDCEATEHPLVNNCINCGRIVCSSEGPGECFFCGEVVTYSDYSLPPGVSKEFDYLDEKYKVPKDAKQTQKSLELRDRLLEFDQNCASRTSVIDDESDWFQSTNTWMTKEEREKWKKMESNMQEMKHLSRLHQKLSVDMMGRVIEERQDPMELYNKMNSIRDTRNQDKNDSSISKTLAESNSNAKKFEGPIYVNHIQKSGIVPKAVDDHFINNRVQDKGLLEISDQGVCLSMHQPYASLLVRGIKKTEGRTWYTAHRGRLWIASASKNPNEQEIANVEGMYKLKGENEMYFPKSYPTGCLLGCVTVTDVLSQEEYNKLHPDDKLDSPYIFICDNFFELPVKYPLQGQHKIYKLEPVLHRAALTCLERTCLEMSKRNS